MGMCICMCMCMVMGMGMCMSDGEAPALASSAAACAASASRAFMRWKRRASSMAAGPIYRCLQSRHVEACQPPEATTHDNRQPSCTAAALPRHAQMSRISRPHGTAALPPVVPVPGSPSLAARALVPMPQATARQWLSVSLSSRLPSSVSSMQMRHGGGRSGGRGWRTRSTSAQPTAQPRAQPPTAQPTAQPPTAQPPPPPSSMANSILLTSVPPVTISSACRHLLRRITSASSSISASPTASESAASHARRCATSTACPVTLTVHSATDTIGRSHVVTSSCWVLEAPSAEAARQRSSRRFRAPSVSFWDASRWRTSSKVDNRASSARRAGSPICLLTERIHTNRSQGSRLEFEKYEDLSELVLQ